MKRMIDALGPYLCGAVIALSFVMLSDGQQVKARMSEAKGACDALHATLDAFERQR